MTPYAIPVSIVGMMSSEISIALELHGISHVVSTGCTSSTDAISYAASLIRGGDAEVILSGGADACVTPGMIFGFSRMRAVSTAHNDRPAEASRPFDRERDGFVLGEGAWMVVLEREDRARARGAPSTRFVEGYGSTCDAYHRVQMDPDGEQIIRAMRLAIERSGRRMEEIGYVNFHGTSTVLNDTVESRCVRRLFGPLADRVPGSSTKSMIGHPQGASGAAGIVTAALALRDNFLPPTINQTIPIPTAIWTSFPIGAATPSCRRRSAIAWVSDRRTARLCWGRRDSQCVDSDSTAQDSGRRQDGATAARAKRGLAGAGGGAPAQTE